MSQAFTKLLIQARKNAGYTQEAAAAILHISLRTIANYEAGRIPTDSIVSEMMRVYNSPYLGYAYLSTESAVGRVLLPEIPQLWGIASMAMQLHISMGKAQVIYDQLERICCDDMVTRSELPEYERCINELEGLFKSILNLKMCTKTSLTATVRA